MSESTIVTTQEAAAEALGMSVEEFKRLREIEGFPGKAGAYDVAGIRQWHASAVEHGVDVPAVGAASEGSESGDGPPHSREAVAEPVRRLKVEAGECPTSPRHNATRVYNTNGQTRYCVCDECGATWKKVGPYADDLRQFCAELADALAEAESTRAGTDQVVVIHDELRKQIVAKLRGLLKS